MKIKLLFVIESLTLGGAEKSLVTLLNCLDYSKYEVDLQLFAYNGPLEVYLPSEVNVLPQLKYFEYVSIPYKNVKYKMKNLKMLISQLKYSFKLRISKSTNIEKAVFFWQISSSCFDVQEKEYDVAIAYAQGVPTFYVADKIKSKHKIAWINSHYNPNNSVYLFICDKYKSFNYINLVSKESLKNFNERFQIFKDRSILIKDVLDYKLNFKLSNEFYPQEFNISDLKILTVGRLSKHKGYDILIEVCKFLKERKLAFKWFIIGEGKEREMLESKINKYKLNNVLILLGAKNNPYPFIKNCDLYVQTSRFEGFGLTIGEAKMFDKLIVSTNFEAVHSQIKHNKNGIIVEKNPSSIANEIVNILYNEKLKNEIISNLKKEEKGNYQEINLFDQLIDKCCNNYDECMYSN